MHNVVALELSVGLVLIKSMKSSSMGRSILCNIAHIFYHLCINQPSPAKCKLWVRPKITAKSAQHRYSVLAIGVMYGVLATLCRSTMLRLRIVFFRSDAAASV